jgi:hypothetical protein
LDDANAVPVGGWEKFNEELNSELRDINATGRFQVYFNLKDGKPQDIQISPANNQEFVQVLSSFIEQKIRWTGEKGGIVIDVQE